MAYMRALNMKMEMEIENPRCDEGFFLDDWKKDIKPPRHLAPDTKPHIISSPFTVPSSASSVLHNSQIINTNANDAPTSNLSFFLGNDNAGAYDWSNKHPNSWNCEEVMMWLYTIVSDSRNGIDPCQFNAESFFGLSGAHLTSMGRNDFMRCDPCWGALIFHAFNEIMREQQHNRPPPSISGPISQIQNGMSESDIRMISFDVDDNFDSIRSLNDRNENRVPSLVEELRNLHAQRVTATPDSDHSNEAPVSPASLADSDSSDTSKKTPKGNHLWEFVRDLLLNSQYNPIYVKWEDREQGIFKFVKSDQVAKLWGQRKNNPGMNYEKMSRAMRYYYKRRILERIDGRRLVYKFGPNATGWRV